MENTTDEYSLAEMGFYKAPLQALRDSKGFLVAYFVVDAPEARLVLELLNDRGQHLRNTKDRIYDNMRPSLSP